MLKKTLWKLQKIVRHCKVTIEISKWESSGHYAEENHIVLNYWNITAVTLPLEILWGRPRIKGWLLAHELGHAFINRENLYVNKRARKLFGNFNQPYRGTWGQILSIFHRKGTSYLTKYAAEHPEEDFAECFAFAVLCADEIDKLPEGILKLKLQFVTETIKNALPCRRVSGRVCVANIDLLRKRLQQ